MAARLQRDLNNTSCGTGSVTLAQMLLPLISQPAAAACWALHIMCGAAVRLLGTGSEGKGLEGEGAEGGGLEGKEAEGQGQGTEGEGQDSESKLAGPRWLVVQAAAALLQRVGVQQLLQCREVLATPLLLPSQRLATGHLLATCQVLGKVGFWG